MVYLIGSGHLPRKQQNETKNIQGFAFDTTYQITIYQGGTKKTLQKCVSECSSLRKCDQSDEGNQYCVPDQCLVKEV